MRQKRVNLEQLPFTLAGLPYTSPYSLIMRNEADTPDNRSDAYFYEVLFSMVVRSLFDAGLSGTEIREMPIFFGSTSMDVPVFESSYLKSHIDRVADVPPVIQWREALHAFAEFSCLRDYGYSG